MDQLKIVRSLTEPAKADLWVKENTIRLYSTCGWVDVADAAIQETIDNINNTINTVQNNITQINNGNNTLASSMLSFQQTIQNNINNLMKASIAGEIKAYAGNITNIINSGYLLCDGTAYNRTSYANLYTALTQKFTYNCGLNTTCITVADTTGLQVGQVIEGSAFAANTQISSIGTGCIFVTIASTKAISGVGETGVAFIYGNGNGTTTFNVPDLRGKVIVGVDSSQTEFVRTNTTGGEKTHTLTTPEIPAHNHGARLYGRTSYMSGSGITAVDPGTKGSDYGGTSISITNEGGGQSHNNLQPYLVLNYIIKY